LKAALEEMAAAGGPGFTGASIRNYLQVLQQHAPTLLDEYIYGPTADQYGKWNMLSYRGRRSTIDGALRAMLHHPAGRATLRAPGRRRPLVPVELGIGAANFAPTGKGETAVPTASMAREVIRCIRVHQLSVRVNNTLDEYRTTKCCYMCGSEMEAAPLLRVVEGSRRSKSTRMRLCAKCGEGCSGDAAPKPQTTLSSGAACQPSNMQAGKRRNRDVNAARNLLMVAFCLNNGHPRPEALQRRQPVESTASSSTQVNKRRRRSPRG
jgi:hypothetical protein